MVSPLELLTVAELAALAKVSQRTIRRRIKDGAISIVRPSPRTIRITIDEAERFLRGHGNGSKPDT